MAIDIAELPFHSDKVGTTITIDKTGRVVIPKEIREELRLEPGDQLAVETDSERVTLRPIHRGSPLRKQSGVWVFAGGKRLSLEDANRLVGGARNRLGDPGNGKPGR
jgi:AbrB family looped-hinge helix DNA binding protein